MATQLTKAQAPDWLAWVTNYDNTRQLFLDNWWALKNARPWVAAKHPELLKQHDAIMQKFLDQVPTIDALGKLRHDVVGFLEGIGATIQTALNFTGIQAGIDWLKGTFGFHGIEPGTVEQNQLGLVPVVWVAISVTTAAASLVAIANMIKDAGLYSQRLNAMRELEERGYTAEQAAGIVNQVVGAPGTSISGTGANFLGIPIMPLFIGAAALVLGPPIINAISKGR